LKRVAVVTGTTHGIGRVTALELARAGYRVVMLCRDQDAAATVRLEILAQVPDALVEVLTCDLASLASVRACAQAVGVRVDAIDLLINNAGMTSTRRRASVDGFELTFATNHLGTFLLTELLRPRIRAPGRIVNVASRVHYKGELNLQRVTDARAHYNGLKAYAQSKLANVLHTFALARRLTGTGITVNCLHPGVVATNLLPPWLRLIKPLISPGIFDPVRGAQTTLYLALAPEVVGMSGHYYDENQRVQTASALAINVAVQERLWEQSLRWVAAPGAISG
jgi:NAD(P)-dependent dehydrogenase (short-subunit alcohol dehydrogenase family)